MTPITSPRMVGMATEPFPEFELQELTNNNDASSKWNQVPASAKSQRTLNPIRAIVDPIVRNIQTGEERGDGKDPISLALGDPTVSTSLPVCQVAMDALVQELPHSIGYIPAVGLPEARRAIATSHGVSPEDVVIASGCSGALELVLGALLNPDDILLVPRPGFPLYQVLAELHGASVLHYDLNPDQNWHCNVTHLTLLLQQYGTRVRGMVINNPSNPTGAVYSEQHLQDLCRLCCHYQVTIVADEVYGDMVFAETQFIPLAKVAQPLQVPMISVSGLGKQYLVPGWRVGWAVLYDNDQQALRAVWQGVQRLAQAILGASHVVQRVIPRLLTPTDPHDVERLHHFRHQLVSTLESQAQLVCRELQSCPGITVAMPPQGAMYCMVKVKGNDVDFCQRLLHEENVVVLPGQAFGMPHMVRLVVCAAPTQLLEAMRRMRAFCQRHYGKKSEE